MLCIVAAPAGQTSIKNIAEIKQKNLVITYPPLCLNKY
jgi:hypothetical protein